MYFFFFIKHAYMKSNVLKSDPGRAFFNSRSKLKNSLGRCMSLAWICKRLRVVCCHVELPLIHSSVCSLCCRFLWGPVWEHKSRTTTRSLWDLVTDIQSIQRHGTLHQGSEEGLLTPPRLWVYTQKLGLSQEHRKEFRPDPCVMEFVPSVCKT